MTQSTKERQELYSTYKYTKPNHLAKAPCTMDQWIISKYIIRNSTECKTSSSLLVKKKITASKRCVFCRSQCTKPKITKANINEHIAYITVIRSLLGIEKFAALNWNIRYLHNEQSPLSNSQNNSPLELPECGIWKNQTTDFWIYCCL